MCFINRYKLTIACMKRDMTMKDLARKSGYSYEWIKRARRGASVSRKTAEDIAQTLNVNVNWLLDTPEHETNDN